MDFFEVLVDVAGQRRKAWIPLRLMHSGRDLAWIYDRQDQVSFLDGHVRAFAHLGSVPQRLIYDNLRAAVARVLVGAERQLAARFEALAAHYVSSRVSRVRARATTRAAWRRAARACGCSAWCRSHPAPQPGPMSAGGGVA